MGHQRSEKSISELLDDIDVVLTGSSRAAARLEDDMPVYLLDMAIRHIRKKALQLLCSRKPVPVPVAAE